MMEAGSFLGLTQESVILISLPIVFILIAIEVLIGSLTNKHYYKKEDTLGTLGMLLGNIVMSVMTKALFFAVLLFVYEFRIFNLSEALSPLLLFIVALFLIDFNFYVWHRASHRVRFLWACHLSHHSSEEMNFVVSFRQAWLAPLLKIPFFSGLPLIGLDPSVVIVVGMISTFWGVVGHTQVIPRLGFVEWFFNTPSAHRVHHGSNPEYIDKNYANMFIIYDRLLGTYAPEKAAVKYGLVNNVKTNNPITITIMPWKKIWQDIKSARSLFEACAYFFGPPDWKPKDYTKHKLNVGPLSGDGFLLQHGLQKDDSQAGV